MIADNVVDLNSGFVRQRPLNSRLCHTC